MTTISKFRANQAVSLPVLVNAANCGGRTFIVTGANTGLGFETARHLVTAGAQKVILACRNKTAGEHAKTEMEGESGNTAHDVVEVWSLDMENLASIQAFAERAAKLHRIDGVIANAGVAGGDWAMWQRAYQVNVLGTFYLSLLMVPILKTSALTHGNDPHLVIVGSETAFMSQAEKEWEKFDQVEAYELLAKLNDPAIADVTTRYPLSKLLGTLATRQLAELEPPEKTGVIINVVNPGLCKTTLTKNAPLWSRLVVGLLKFTLGRTAEEGSRAILHGVIADKESHGCYLSTCRISEDEVPEWVTDTNGKKMQMAVWDALVAEVEAFDANCLTDGFTAV